MDQNKINEAYKYFKINVDELPEYSSPYEHANGFKKFTLLESVNTSYSGNAGKKN